jgi:hypothetical protein
MSFTDILDKNHMDRAVQKIREKLKTAGISVEVWRKELDKNEFFCVRFWDGAVDFLPIAMIKQSVSFQDYNVTMGKDPDNCLLAVYVDPLTNAHHGLFCGKHRESFKHLSSPQDQQPLSIDQLEERLDQTPQ